MNLALAKIDALVLAGGLGSRLAGVLADLPKVLAPIDGRPFLDYQLDFLAENGIRRVVLSLGYRADIVLDHLAQTTMPLEVEPVVEPKPLGTAGAIGFARTALKSDPALLINGDTWLDTDLAKMLQTHQTPPMPLATIACVRIEDTKRYGAVELSANGMIGRFVEKDQTASGDGFVNGGVYMLAARMLDSLTVSSGSLERDVLPHLAPGTLRAHLIDRAKFLDIGTPESYARAAACLPPRSSKLLVEGRE
jgi:NDP-sugar pyrophosphorylase family protein